MPRQTIVDLPAKGNGTSFPRSELNLGGKHQFIRLTQEHRGLEEHRCGGIPLVLELDRTSTRFFTGVKVGKSVQHANLAARGEGKEEEGSPEPSSKTTSHQLLEMV